MRFKIVMFLVFILAGSARFFAPDLAPGNRTPDEKIYLGYIDELAQHGTGRAGALLEAYASDPEFLKYPPPTRVGYIGVASSVKRLSGKTGLDSAILVSRLFSIFSLAFWVFFAWRFFGRETSLALLFFLGFSPIDLGLANRVWPDAFSACWSALLFWMAAETVRRHSWKTGIAFSSAVFVSVLSKEFGLVLSLMAGLGGVVVCLHQEKTRAAKGLLASFLIGLLAAILVIKGSFGELSKTLALLSEVGRTISKNPYALEHQGGGLPAFVVGLFFAGPAAFFFFWVGFVRAAFHRQGVGWAGVVFIVALLILCLAPYSVNLRYLSGVYGLYYLMAAYGLKHLTTMVEGHRPRQIVFLSLLVILAGLDCFHALQLFSPFKVTDLVPSTFFPSI